MPRTNASAAINAKLLSPPFFKRSTYLCCISRSVSNVGAGEAVVVPLGGIVLTNFFMSCLLLVPIIWASDLTGSLALATPTADPFSAGVAIVFSSVRCRLSPVPTFEGAPAPRRGLLLREHGKFPTRAQSQQAFAAPKTGDE